MSAVALEGLVQSLWKITLMVSSGISWLSLKKSRHLVGTKNTLLGCMMGNVGPSVS